MFRSRKGFTLIELLAVIVVLAIIMVIATTTVNRTIKKARTDAFISNIDMASKNAKRILAIEGRLDTILLKESLDYQESEYDFEVEKVAGGYIIKLISNTSGKYKDVDFSTIPQNNRYICEEDAGNVRGRNIIGLQINDDGDIKDFGTMDDENKKIAESIIREGCTAFTKKEKYDIGDIISFCNEETKKSEDFYVLEDNGTTVTALARYNLKVGSKSKLSGDTPPTIISEPLSSSFVNYGLQDKNASAILDTEFKHQNQNWNATKFDNEDKSKCNAESEELRGNCIGYWANDDGSLKNEYKVSDVTNYPVDVYKGNALIKSYVESYVEKLKAISRKTNFSGRLITLSDLQKFGCDIRVSGEAGICDTAAVRQKNGQWIYNTTYWTSTANNSKEMWTVLSNSGVTSYNDLGIEFNFLSIYGIRPVITINRSGV